MITNEFINRAIEYILTHINEDISVDDVAAYCNFSRFYFSRIFKMETGESLYGFIKRVKMEQSAFRLKVEKGRSITDIGCDYGFSSSNYSSAFKQHYNLSPSEFRQSVLEKSVLNPILNNSTISLESFEECNKKISIENLKDTPVIYERHKGDYSDLTIHWNKFLEQYKEYISEDTQQFERSYDDPSVTNRDECLCDICITAPQNCKLANTYVLQGGLFAVYHFNGHVSQIYAAYQSIFNNWLPEIKYTIDERYGFDIYRNIDGESMVMKIDFCIPIK